MYRLSIDDEYHISGADRDVAEGVGGESDAYRVAGEKSWEVGVEVCKAWGEDCGVCVAFIVYYQIHLVHEQIRPHTTWLNIA